MEVSQASFKAMKNEKMPSLIGYASIVIDDALIIKDIKVISGRYGPFLGFPSRKGGDDKYYDIVFPKSKELRNEMTAAVLKEVGSIGVDDDEDLFG